MASEDDLVVRIVGDTTKLQEATKRGKDELAAFKRSAKEAGKVIEDISTPQEKFARKQAELNKLLMNGHLTQDQYMKAMKKARGELDKQTTSSGKLEDQTKKTDTALGGSARGNIAKYIGSMASLGAAVGLVTTGLRSLQTEAQRGLASMEANQDPNRRLSQIATSGADLERMTGQADAAARRFGIDRAAARNLMFSARSEGFDNQFGDVARASQLLGTEATATVAGQFRGLFAGRQDLSVNQALSGVLSAARSSRLDFGEIAAAAPAAAETAGAAGTSAEELLASMSVLSTRFKSGLTAGDRLKAFQARVGQTEGLRGKGILGSFKALQGMSEEDRTEALGGSVEVQAVYDALLQDALTIKQRRAEIAADFASGGSTLETQLTIQESDAKFITDRRQRQGKIERDIANEQAGQREAERQAAIDLRRGQTRGNTALAFAAGVLESEIPIVGGSVTDLMTFGQGARGQDLARAQADAAAKQAEAATELQRRQLEEQQKQTELLRAQSQPAVIDTVQ